MMVTVTTPGVETCEVPVLVAAAGDGSLVADFETHCPDSQISVVRHSMSLVQLAALAIAQCKNITNETSRASALD